MDIDLSQIDVDKIIGDQIIGVYFEELEGQVPDFDHLLLESLVLCCENDYVKFTYLHETAEIKATLFLNQEYDFSNSKKVFTKFDGKRLFSISRCVNYRGYTDAYCLAFDKLYPDLFIYSGSGLAFFDMTVCKYEDFSSYIN